MLSRSLFTSVLDFPREQTASIISKEMKRRACRHHCGLCNLSFETWSRYSMHVSSRNHLGKEATARTENIQLVVDELVPKSDYILRSDDENDVMCTTLEYENDTMELECFPGAEFSSNGEELFDCGHTSDIVLTQITNDDSGFFSIPIGDIFSVIQLRS